MWDATVNVLVRKDIIIYIESPPFLFPQGKKKKVIKEPRKSLLIVTSQLQALGPWLHSTCKKNKAWCVSSLFGLERGVKQCVPSNPVPMLV